MKKKFLNSNTFNRMITLKLFLDIFENFIFTNSSLIKIIIIISKNS